MAELLEALASWSSLVLVVVVFGFAPGFCLRLIVLAYPRGDPRRAELIAELYAVPRIQRPLWVAEQLEVALFEGLPHRVSAARAQTGTRGARRGRAAFGLLTVLGGAVLYISDQVAAQAAAQDARAAMVTQLFPDPPKSATPITVYMSTSRGDLTVDRTTVLNNPGDYRLWYIDDQTASDVDRGSGWVSVFSICLSITGLLVMLVAMLSQLRKLPRLLTRRERTG